MAKTQKSMQSVNDIDTIIDLDNHIPQPVEKLGPYLEEPYRSYLSGEDGEFSEEHWSSPSDDLFVTLGGKTGRGRGHMAQSPKDQAEMMEEHGLNYSLLTPSTTAVLPVFSNHHFAHAMAKAINDRLIDEYLEEDDRFKGVVSLAPHQPDLAAEEIHRVANHDDIVAGYMSSHLHPALGNRKYWPMFEALIEHDLPLFLHGATVTLFGANPWVKRSLETYLEVTTIAHPLPQILNLISLLGQGIPERYPELDIVFEEAGIEWIPMVLFRMDDEYGMRRPEAPLLEKPPSHYVKDPDGPFYFTSQPTGEADNSEHIAQLIDMFNGTENLMFASDWPHYDYDAPEEFFGTINPHMEPEDINNIFGGTAADLLEL
jgi:predicted TIM-barrel fold metal-dependent hydrolase